jgi:hypothetical protein
VAVQPRKSCRCRWVHYHPHADINHRPVRVAPQMIEHFLIQNGALFELPLPEVSDTLLATIFNGTKVPGFETETLPQVQHFQPASFPVSFDLVCRDGPKESSQLLERVGLHGPTQLRRVLNSFLAVPCTMNGRFVFADCHRPHSTVHSPPFEDFSSRELNLLKRVYMIITIRSSSSSFFLRESSSSSKTRITTSHFSVR